jgi:hypothetical protein
MAQSKLSLVAQCSRRKRHVLSIVIQEHFEQWSEKRRFRVSYVDAKIELAYCGCVQSPLTQNSSRTSRLQNARCRCESDEGLKVEIPN